MLWEVLSILGVFVVNYILGFLACVVLDVVVGLEVVCGLLYGLLPT